MLDTQVLTFFAVATVLTITPGADTFLVMRTVMAHGTRSGFVAAAGICLGLFVHAVLSALGLSLILVRSAALFEAVKYVGAAYLVLLGVQSLLSAWRRDTPTQAEGARAVRRYRQSFAEGILSNVLNPKVAVFYLAFLPQFISTSDPVFAKSMLLTALHFTLGIVWLSSIAFLFGRARAFLSRPRVTRGLEAVAGTVLIGFGIRLALAKR